MHCHRLFLQSTSSPSASIFFEFFVQPRPLQRSILSILPVLYQLVYVYSLLIRSTSVLGRVWLFNLVSLTQVSPLLTRITSRLSWPVVRNFCSGLSAELIHQGHHPRGIYLAESDTYITAHRKLAHESTRHTDILQIHETQPTGGSIYLRPPDSIGTVLLHFMKHLGPDAHLLVCFCYSMHLFIWKFINTEGRSRKQSSRKSISLSNARAILQERQGPLYRLGRTS